MTIPDKVNARWIASLGNDQLVKAESTLHAVFLKHELDEKKRTGARYTMLRGPEALVTAWHRWVVVNNETVARGLLVNRRRSASHRLAVNTNTAVE
jgi:hypothetical protein